VKLRLRDEIWDVGPGDPVLMGIVNATPDSVADAERLTTTAAQVARALELVDAGARIVDVGGESGRTDVAPVSSEEEIARVLPLVERLVAEGVTVSVDTWKAAVARAAAEAGAAMINDVSGLRDPALADVAARSGAALVVMHTRAAPKAEQFPPYEDVVADVTAFLRERMALAESRGVGREQLVIDPGPDFAKRPEDSVELLHRLGELESLERPLLLAVSRKYFLGALTGRTPDDRLAGTLAAVAHGVDSGASIVRVHDVREVADHLRVRAALRSTARAELVADAGAERLKWLPPAR